MARTPEYYLGQAKRMQQLAREAERKIAEAVGRAIIRHWPDLDKARPEIKEILEPAAETKSEAKPTPKLETKPAETLKQPAEKKG